MVLKGPRHSPLVGVPCASNPNDVLNAARLGAHDPDYFVVQKGDKPKMKKYVDICRTADFSFFPFAFCWSTPATGDSDMDCRWGRMPTAAELLCGSSCVRSTRSSLRILRDRL